MFDSNFFFLCVKREQVLIQDLTILGLSIKFFPLDMFVMIHHLGWTSSHALPATSQRHELSSYLSEDVGTLLAVKECGHVCACPTHTFLFKVKTIFFIALQNDI